MDDVKNIILLELLKEPFLEKDIEWRILRSGVYNGKPYGQVYAYVTNRAIMDRLDEVCGSDCWKNELLVLEKGVLCGIAIYINTQWITKWDGADYTDYEAFKGGISASMKRAATQWGIGRYLYSLDKMYAIYCENGIYKDKIDNKTYKWNPPTLPSWAVKKTGQEQPISKTTEQELKSIKDGLREERKQDDLLDIY